VNLASRVAVFGDGHPRTLDARDALGTVLRLSGRSADAAAVHSRVARPRPRPSRHAGVAPGAGARRRGRGRPRLVLRGAGPAPPRRRNGLRASRLPDHGRPCGGRGRRPRARPGRPRRAPAGAGLLGYGVDAWAEPPRHRGSAGGTGRCGGHPVARTVRPAGRGHISSRAISDSGRTWPPSTTRH
jgi:hypothetical protein